MEILTCWAQNCDWFCGQARHSSWHNSGTGQVKKWSYEHEESESTMHCTGELEEKPRSVCLHLLGNVNCPVWNSAWVKNLVAVLIPSQPDQCLSATSLPAKDHGEKPKM